MSPRRTSAALAAAALLLAAAVPSLAEKGIRLRPLATATRHLEAGALRGPMGLAYDGVADEIWIADTGNHVIGAFKPDGTPLFTTGGGGLLREPTRIAVGQSGDLWVLTLDRSQVVHLDWRGRLLLEPMLEGLPGNPSIGAIVLDDRGNLYVGENTEGRIHVFDTDLRPWFRFGSRGREKGQFISIADIAVTGDWIAVTDAVGRPVQIFNRQGEFVRSWGEHAIGAENFSLPQGVDIDQEDRVFVVDSLRHEIKLFDIDGRFLGRFGGMGSGPGQISYPSDVVVDGSGHLYVTERGNGRMQAFAIEEFEAPAPEPRTPKRRKSARRR